MKMKLDVLSTMQFIAEVWQLPILTTIKNCFVKCGFLIDHVYSSNDRIMKLCENEEDDWHSLQPLGVQFEDYITCDVLSRFMKSKLLTMCWINSWLRHKKRKR
jgi:hypothetical protein